MTLTPENIPQLLLALIAINAFTYLVFWLDKRRAKNNDWRIPEGVLLGCSLLGGSPTAYVAMRILRHKTRKTSFRVRYWIVVLLQLLAIGYWLFSPDASF